MATGDQEDFFNRLKLNLVSGWFGQNAPVKDALLQGIAKVDSEIFQINKVSYNDARIKTATGEALDLISLDYYGGDLPRHAGENDASFLNRILALLLQERATRNGIISVITKLTGRVPTFIEGFNPTDIGAYDQSLYYDQFGGYGWLQPYTGILYVYKPLPKGFIFVGGYDQTQYGGFGYDFNFNNAYVDLSQEVIFVTDQDILETVEKTKVYGTKIYVFILD